MFLVVTGCDRPTVRRGDALRDVPTSNVILKSIGPGSRVGILVLLIENVSSEPLTIDGVRLEGDGVGTTIVAVRWQAVLPGTAVKNQFPYGTFVTDPPVFEIDGICHTPLLGPIRRRLGPGEAIRAWTIVRAVDPGAFRVRNQVVTYRLGDDRFVEAVPLGFQGRIEDGAGHPKIDNAERACLDGSGSLNARDRPSSPAAASAGSAGAS